MQVPSPASRLSQGAKKTVPLIDPPSSPLPGPHSLGMQMLPEGKPEATQTASGSLQSEVVLQGW
jgi:hypothetical protein